MKQFRWKWIKYVSAHTNSNKKSDKIERWITNLIWLLFWWRSCHSQWLWTVIRWTFWHNSPMKVIKCCWRASLSCLPVIISTAVMSRAHHHRYRVELLQDKTLHRKLTVVVCLWNVDFVVRFYRAGGEYSSEVVGIRARHHVWIWRSHFGDRVKVKSPAKRQLCNFTENNININIIEKDLISLSSLVRLKQETKNMFTTFYAMLLLFIEANLNFLGFSQVRSIDEDLYRVQVWRVSLVLFAIISVNCYHRNSQLKS